MSIANTVLEEALKNINPEKIEELMDKLQENAEMVQEVNGLLSAGVMDFDEEKALLELEGGEKKEEETELHLPSVPLLKKEEEKNNKILDLEI
jgi:hypothetical protein